MFLNVDGTIGLGTGVETASEARKDVLTMLRKMDASMVDVGLLMKLMELEVVLVECARMVIAVMVMVVRWLIVGVEEDCEA